MAAIKHAAFVKNTDSNTVRVAPHDEKNDDDQLDYRVEDDDEEREIWDLLPGKRAR